MLTQILSLYSQHHLECVSVKCLPASVGTVGEASRAGLLGRVYRLESSMCLWVLIFNQG